LVPTLSITGLTWHGNGAAWGWTNVNECLQQANGILILSSPSDKEKYICGFYVNGARPTVSVTSNTSHLTDFLDRVEDSRGAIFIAINLQISRPSQKPMQDKRSYPEICMRGM